MDIYITSKNTGPTTFGSDPHHTLYIGLDLEEAINSVGDFKRYERFYDRSPEFEYLYSSIPRDMEREMVKYYMADGWWYSIVKIAL